MGRRTQMAILGGISAALLSLPWLVPHAGIAALVAFVPLLLLEQIAFRSRIRHFWLWHYAVFVLWNAFTTFWVCNATVGGGLFAIFANALQMSVIFGVFHFSRSHLRGAAPYVLLAALWIAWERLYFDAQISWPWLVLGNAFARSISLVQWYEYTGSLGGSLWVWVSNLGIFALLNLFRDSDRSRMRLKIATLAGTVLFIAAPMVLSLCIWNNYSEASDAGCLEAAVLQPNLDPYEKFESLSQSQQNERLLALASKPLSERSDSADLLLLAPETFTGDVIVNSIPSGKTWRCFDTLLRSHPGVNILYGASSHEIFNTLSPPSLLARPYGRGWVESHNSALIQDWTARTEIFHKSKLVVGTELMPYPKIFAPIDNALGGVIGRCVGQDEISLLNFSRADGSIVPLGCAICYESVYGEYCTGYVRKGAQALTVITNDAWWGDTPGYVQHLSYSSLRAIELRRDIARCANTGISAFINQRGEVLSASQWWRAETLRGKINLTDKVTAFVRYGDVVGRTAVFAALLLLAGLLLSLLPGRRSKS